MSSLESNIAARAREPFTRRFDVHRLRMYGWLGLVWRPEPLGIGITSVGCDANLDLAGARIAERLRTRLPAAAVNDPERVVGGPSKPLLRIGAEFGRHEAQILLRRTGEDLNVGAHVFMRLEPGRLPVALGLIASLLLYGSLFEGRTGRDPLAISLVGVAFVVFVATVFVVGLLLLWLKTTSLVRWWRAARLTDVRDWDDLIVFANAVSASTEEAVVGITHEQGLRSAEAIVRRDWDSLTFGSRERWRAVTPREGILH